jgi:hypothetical protein
VVITPVDASARQLVAASSASSVQRSARCMTSLRPARAPTEGVA